ncbi:MAG TPA: N-acetylmuramoyl-L-alanine amidase [Candidatus Krumholzibacteria bacterium]|nr:N-acetylmuramoyl-L-alanine amidase [Candidatus Krumholzibacteria bacterium]
MNTRIVILAFAVFAAALLPAVPAADTTAEVVYDDGRASESVVLVRVSDEGGWFMRANDVARLFRATQFWNASSRKIVLGVGRTRFVLTVDTRVVVVDGEPNMMRSAVRYEEGFVLVPLEFVLEVASQHTPRAFEWNEGERRLSIKGIGYNATRIVFTSSSERTTAAIQLTEPLVYHVDTSAPGLVRIKLYGGRIDLRAFTVRQARGFVAGVRAEQTERDAYVTIDLARGVRRVRVDRADEPPQLLVVLETGDAPADAAPGYVEVVEDGAGKRRSLEVRKVCIDAGHGGRELGKESAGGVREKDVNLAIARAVRDRITQELGVEVVMTRDDDRTLGLLERTEIANTSGADLFVSIHCNAWFNDQTGGFETYFLSPARSESERALARFENQGGGDAAQAATGDVEFILWDLVQNEYIAESSTLAEYIQKEMTARLGIKSRGVKQANFVVLQGARMPAVLIETAFLSNPAEEQLLADPEFHGRVAEGLIEAIRRMQERYR